MNITLKRILFLISKYKIYLFFSFIFASIKVFLTLLVPIYIGFAIDTFLLNGDVLFNKLINILFKIIIIVILASISSYIMSIINYKIIYLLSKELRNMAFSKISKLEVLYIDTHKHGDIINRVVSDVESFSEGLLAGFSEFFANILRIIITIIFMFIINYKISLIVIILTPLSLFVSKFLAKYSYKYFKEQAIYRSELTSISNEMISSFNTVKNFGAENLVLDKYKKINENLARESIKALFYSAASMPSTRFVNSIIYLVIGVIGSIIVVSSAMTVGSLSSFLAYASSYSKPFSEISSLLAELQNSIANAERIFAFIDEKEIEKDSRKSIYINKFNSNIKLENINFSYSKNKKFIENLNLEICKGKKIAIVGATGSGKTTLINLLSRFYEIDAGNIKIDDINIKDIKRSSLHSFYGMVFQDTWLKNDTIFNNIAMSKENATKEEVILAAKLAHADNFINKLEKGYDTVLNSSSDNISSGQKQLITIARIMLNLPEVLILDEATSSVDTRTEFELSKAFSKIMEGRTSFIVAHRLKTIKEADLILVMKNGKLIEKGTHLELFNKKGYYRELYDSQFVG